MAYKGDGFLVILVAAVFITGAIVHELDTSKPIEPTPVSYYRPSYIEPTPEPEHHDAPLMTPEQTQDMKELLKDIEISEMKQRIDLIEMHQDEQKLDSIIIK